MKVEVHLPERGTRAAKIVEIEIDNSVHGPRITISSQLGEQLDSFLIAHLLDCGQTLEELIEHECKQDDCDKSHCEDGNCYSMDASEVKELVNKLKHTFHALENLLP